MIRRVLTALATLALSFPAADVSAQAVRAYRVEAISGHSTSGFGINKDGDIAGCEIMPDGTLHAFRWTRAAGFEDLGANGSTWACAYAINDAGDVVGLYQDPTAFLNHPFIARKGAAMQNLHLTYPEIFDLRGIANDGSLVGVSNEFLPLRTLPDGTLRPLPFASGGGMALNAAGEMTGYAYFGTSPQYTAFRHSDAAGAVDLGALGGEYSMGTAINAGGTVVGYYDGGQGPSRAFRAVPGSAMQDLGVVSGSQPGIGASAYGINGAGAIVGSSDVPGTSLAFIYTDAEGMVDLNGLIPLADRARYPMYQARGINEAGQIVADYYDGSFWGTVRLVPVVRFNPPVSRPVAAPSVLRPANGRMVSVTINPRVTDEFDPTPSCHIARVTNTDLLFAQNDPDVRITSALTVDLRASVRGGFAGRLYTVAVACSNQFGKTSTAYTIVSVSR
jgi:probable HAF family extracellular repeat protein